MHAVMAGNTVPSVAAGRDSGQLRLPVSAWRLPGAPGRGSILVSGCPGQLDQERGPNDT